LGDKHLQEAWANFTTLATLSGGNATSPLFSIALEGVAAQALGHEVFYNEQTLDKNGEAAPPLNQQIVEWNVTGRLKRA
jgi:hypothetical protein